MASRNQRMPVDGRDMGRFLSTTVGSFVQDLLLDRDRRWRLKDHCADRLAAETSASGSGTSTATSYSDQAVLANLDWGIEALEEAIATSNDEAKLARLDHAERMLHVPAMLDPSLSTAGVPNSYLSAWAHLNLSFLSALRSAGPAVVLHALEVFVVDPFFARVDFAPDLWESLFLPHMGSIAGWYAEARHRAVMDAVPDSADLSFAVDDPLFDEGVVLGLRPDRAERVRELERAYAKSLDDNTRLFARYYKDCAAYDPAAAGGGRKGVGMMMMMPIAEPPMSPVHEVSRSIPGFVKFGPVLPKSAGFSSALRSNGGNENCSSKAAAAADDDDCRPKLTKGLDAPARQSTQETLLKRDMNETGSSGSDSNNDSQLLAGRIVLKSAKANSKGIGSKTQLLKKKDHCDSPGSLSLVESPKIHSPNVSSPNPTIPSKKAPEQFLRLVSCRISPSKDGSSSDSPKMSSPKVSSPKVDKENDSSRHRPSRYSVSMMASPGNAHRVGSGDSDKEEEAQRDSRHSSTCLESQSSRTETNSMETRYYEECKEEASKSGMHSPSPISSKVRPPKDFVCPITSQLFSDPVTLETGQTYERKAIQEWLKRGNTTCPITRQPLSAIALPKTNYVLRRLITSWKEQHPQLAQEFSFSETPRASRGMASEYPSTQTIVSASKGDIRSKRFMRAAVSTSPTSVISQVAIETVINELKPYASCLCTSQDLQECEAAVLTIARIWNDSKANHGILMYLSKATFVNGFMEILSASVNREVLRASIYILSEFIVANESVRETLTSVDSDLDCLVSLLKNGLVEASVLIYQLRPTVSQICSHDMIPSLIQVISSKDGGSDDFLLAMEPEDAAISVLEQVLSGGDDKSRSLNALSVISANSIPLLVNCLERTGSRMLVVSILLNCMRADRSCRDLIACKLELATVLELIHSGDDTSRSICISFIYELVHLNRRTFCNHILQKIRAEGTFSTMHTFLLCLQMAPMEQQPEVSSLLLQLDLLVKPLKMSIYREDAIEALIEAICRKDFPVCQHRALDVLLSLSGRLSVSGKPLLEAWLLKTAGIEQPYNTLMNERGQKIVDDELMEKKDEEEKATNDWEKRVAFVLCNHENGSIFKALGECFRINSVEIAKSCLVITTWLVHTLNHLPDTGLKSIAGHCLLDQLLDVIQSSRNLQDKILVSLALKSFASDEDALKEISARVKRIYKPLRKLKRCSFVVTEILQAVVNLPYVDITDLWSCSEVANQDASGNGEVLALIYLKGRLFSGHSDGTIKVWEAGKQYLKLTQEVHEHTKAVTCLSAPSSGDKIYSGSLDRTIRVWTTRKEIHCIQVHEMKEAVYALAANNNFAYFSSQGTGIKAYNWEGVSRNVIFQKNVRCIAMVEDILYCGCTGSCIQEVNLSKGTSSAFFSGTRKLLGKQTVNAVCIHNGHLFSGGSSVDGIAGKVFSLTTRTSTGSIFTGLDIHSIAASDEFVFTGTRSGIIEVWLRERLTKVSSLKMLGGANTKITCLALDNEGELLFASSSDGRIQVWALE